MEKISNYVRAWFANADEDLRGAVALHELDPMKYLRLVPYHYQQVVEKSLKGYLSYKKIKFEKSHDIESLTKLAKPLSPELEKLLEEAVVLTAFAIQFRYPDADKAEPTLQDSEFSIRLAKAVCHGFLLLLRREGPMGF